MSVDLSLGTVDGISQAINNTGGSGVTLPSATGTTAGLMSAADKTIINDLDYTYIKQGGNPIVGNLILGMSGSHGYVFQSGGTTVATLDSGGSFAASSVKNIGGSAFAYVGLTSSGTAISRAVADANPVLLVNQLNASSTGNTLTLRKSGTDQLTVDYQGNLTVLGTIKSTSGMGPLSLSGAPGVKISSTGYGSVLSTTYLTADRTVEMPNAGGTSTVIGTTAPASANDTGVVGEIRVTSTYVYVCIATDTWVRAPFATW